ncbi:MAG: GntR family transcriptional regulator [Christensenellales bacterium]
MKDKSPFVPKYKQVYESIAQRILCGEFPEGARLPCERELCEHYQVKRVTVRRALEMLDSNGLAEKRHGLGTYVKAADKPQSINRDTVVFAMRRNQNDIRHNVNAFNAMLFFLLEQCCHEHGLRLQYTGLDENVVEPQLTAPHVLGVMLISHHEAGVAEKLWKRGMPTICVNHRERQAVSLLPDNFNGIRLAVEHLKALGHTHIGMIGGPVVNINAEERLMGYQYGLLEQGLTIANELIAPGLWTMESGREAMVHLMQLSPRPTAVIAASDMMAIGAIDAACRLNLSVPKDVSIVGFDGIDMGLYCSPPLTTIGMDARALARLSVEAMLHAASSPERAHDNHIIRLPPTLIVRQSTTHSSD